MQSYFVISYLWRGKSWWKRGFITCFQNAYCKSSGIWDWVRFQIEPTSMICSWERLRPFLPNTAGGWASWCSQRRLGSTPVRSLQRWSGAGGECSKPHLAIYGSLSGRSLKMGSDTLPKLLSFHVFSKYMMGNQDDRAFFILIASWMHATWPEMNWSSALTGDLIGNGIWMAY